jgi:hypothetical protein
MVPCQPATPAAAAAAPGGAAPPPLPLLAAVLTRREAVSFADVAIIGVADMQQLLLGVSTGGATGCTPPLLLARWLHSFRQYAVPLPGTTVATPAAVAAAVRLLEAAAALLAGLCAGDDAAGSSSGDNARAGAGAAVLITERLIAALQLLKSIMAMPGVGSVGDMLTLWRRVLHDDAVSAADVAVLQLAGRL